MRPASFARAPCAASGPTPAPAALPAALPGAIAKRAPSLLGTITILLYRREVGVAPKPVVWIEVKPPATGAGGFTSPGGDQEGLPEAAQWTATPAGPLRFWTGFARELAAPVVALKTERVPASKLFDAKFET